MISQVVLSSEGLLADVATEGSFVRVRSLVNEEIVAFRESAIAIFADELFLRPRRSSSSRSLFQRRFPRRWTATAAISDYGRKLI